MSHHSSVIVPSLTGNRLSALLDSLAEQTVAHQVIVVDNGSDGSVERACERHPGVERLRFERNLGFSRAVNAGAARADGDVLLMVNDDVVCDPSFVAELAGAIDPATGITIATGVLRDAADPRLIETAGVELDHTLAMKKLELMVGLQQKLAGVGRTDDKLDAEIGALAAQVAEWRAREEAKAPKAKRPMALNVIKDGSGAGSSAQVNRAKARTEQD